MVERIMVRVSRDAVLVKGQDLERGAAVERWLDGRRGGAKRKTKAYGRDAMFQNIRPNDISDERCVPSHGDVVLEAPMWFIRSSGHEETSDVDAARTRICPTYWWSRTQAPSRLNTKDVEAPHEFL